MVTTKTRKKFSWTLPEQIHVGLTELSMLAYKKQHPNTPPRKNLEIQILKILFAAPEHTIPLFDLKRRTRTHDPLFRQALNHLRNHGHVKTNRNTLFQLTAEGYHYIESLITPMEFVLRQIENLSYEHQQILYRTISRVITSQQMEKQIDPTYFCHHCIFFNQPSPPVHQDHAHFCSYTNLPI